jgi:multidrug efflux pump subunit AcrA (membrane-fusion protein)
MNYSLPEVAAQYPQSTTLTTKVRGSGTVEAAQTYNVTLQETRTVAAVNVKVGDTVKAGDTLLTLDETESQELTDARTQYNNLKLEYDKMALEKADQTNATSAALQQAQEAVAQAQSDLSSAQTYESNIKSYQAAVTSAQNTLDAKQQAQAAADRNVSLLENEKNNLTTTNQDYLAADQKVRAAQAEVTRLEALEPAADPESEEPAVESAELTAARAALTQAQTDRDNLLADLTLEVDQRIASATATQINASYAVTEASNALSTAQNAMSQYQSTYTGPTSVESAKSALQAAQDSLTSLQATAADTAAQQTYDDASAQLDLDAKAQELQEAQEKVEKLEEKTAAAKIVSRYGGVVQSINIAAGDTTDPETPLMVVELTEKGYTLTATVTKDQARLLREGLTAEITNIWNSDIEMTLTSITADKSDPASSRTLSFQVQGEDVTVGQQLNFSLGDKNYSYDVVIPTAAIHTDADGSFVYTVVVKSSPLGNRYTVKKTTVTVIAADDSNSAVSGDLSTADFVITTATVPLQPGDQVRIAQ